MTTPLIGPKILILNYHFGTETSDIQRLIIIMHDAGKADTRTATEAGVVKTLELDRELGAEVPVDVTYDSVDASDFDVVVLPGGTLNGDNLRTDETVQGLLRSFSAAGKPVAAICHAPWTLIEAGLVDGQKLTSVPTIRTDLVNAGGNWSDEEVVVDDAKGFPLITSRGPDDLDAFNGAIIEALS